ncbi:MAG: S8 family serine peptidase [Cyclobacteriaceae bacterium]
MKNILFTISILFLAIDVIAQQPSEQNRKELLLLAAELDSAYKKEQAKLAELLPKNANGRVSVSGTPSGISPTGKILYTINHNSGASQATRTNDLYPGGRLSASVTGNGMIIGVWEIGSPDPAHPEFQGRLIVKDAAGEVSDHATHVSGTLMAGGVDSDARGMAYEAIAHAYSHSNDLSEIAVAAADGLLVSSHSYGKSAGWNSSGNWLGDEEISDVEDWKFGIYNEAAAAVDQIAFLAPYYLLVRSAGNERGEDGTSEFPPDGPYDSMTGEAIAKNILTVGNVNPLKPVPVEKEDFLLSNSSSWGPSDDGRIKPDLVAPGVNIHSASTDSDGYDLKSGTSMSTPVVAGNSLLLQQLHNRLYASYMKAATLKGILLHTTIDAGSFDGPDYSFGYGFLNANLAARTISEKGHLTTIEENTMIEGQSFTTQFEVVDPNTPLVVSISWTDPAGDPISGAVLDPVELNLVNDLDLRVTDPLSKVELPWRLDPFNPTGAATKGDNFRDNYEKIEIKNPSAGTYSISISHKSQLMNGKQDYTLVITNLPLDDHRSTFYWIGESGEWEDPTKWSHSSGGGSVGLIPSIEDRVIFDENSFNGNRTVTLNGPASIFQLEWLIGNESKINFNGNTLNVTHSINLDGSISKTSGSILLQPNPSAAGNVLINGNNQELSLKMAEVGNEFLLSGEEIILKEVELASGNLTILNNFSAENIVFSSTVMKEIDMSNLEITASKIDLGNLVSNQVLFEDSKITIDGGNGLHEIRSEGFFELPQLVVNAGMLSILNDGKIGDVEVHSGSTISLADLVQLDLDNLSIESTAESRTKIMTPGSATIFSNSHSKFCFDFVDIDNVSVDGTAKFVYESNSTLINGNGWLAAQCADVLFSDFTVTSPCAQNTTFFTDMSDGNPENWIWDFGDGTTSSEQNPIHSYSDLGIYTVKLSIKKGNEASDFSQEIEVIESSVGKPIIILQNGRLLTNSPGAFFQWFLDGKPIPGEVSRVLSEEPGDGFYQVEASDESCLGLSDPFVPLSAVDKPYEISIYPSPAKDFVTIYLNETILPTEISILDLGGKTMKRFEPHFHDRTERIPVYDYSPGIYFLVVKTSTKTILIKKIAISR